MNARYRVVCVRGDGHREVYASNLGKDTAEAVRDAALKSGRFVRVVVERQASRNELPSR
jgi:hypothetical protein